MLIPVLLSGGVGSRLWPLSRQNYPKQFLPLIEETSLFHETLLRLHGISGVAQTLIIAQQEHRFLIAEQLRSLGCLEDTTLILEPEGKSTAPAAALAAFYALKEGYPSAQLLVLPADHLIQDVAGFHKSIQAASRLAGQGKLVTFGVKPLRPDTGYGYLETGDKIGDTGGLCVQKFTEKPDKLTAVKYFEGKKHWWNSGMFLFEVQTFLENLQVFAPEIYSATQKAVEQAEVSNDFILPEALSFKDSPADSIDYAIMEKSQDVAMIPLETDWCDVGSWSVLADQFQKDDSNNVCQGNVFTYGCENTYLRSESRLVAGVGLKNTIVIETPDALLVMDKDTDQDIKFLIGQLKQANRPELAFHRKVHRPWGAFEGLDKGARYQVKRITVTPGSQLSLQMHHHRSEHWVVVKGSAKVTRGEESFLLTENQSTYIPIGVVHRLENVGKIDLEIIEVQSGSYLGEDDIIRLEDTYGRKKEQASVTID